MSWLSESMRSDRTAITSFPDGAERCVITLLVDLDLAESRRVVLPSGVVIFVSVFTPLSSVQPVRTKAEPEEHDAGQECADGLPHECVPHNANWNLDGSTTPLGVRSLAVIAGHCHCNARADPSQIRRLQFSI